MIAHDWFEWTSATVGAAGLVLTLGAFWQASGARKAAREARTAVRERNAIDSFAEVVRFARQVHVWVDCERYSEARVHLGEIVLHLAHDRGGFDYFLSADADRLKEIELDCLQLDDELAKDGQFVPRMPKLEMLNLAMRIAQELSALLGRMRARGEKEK
jgi:hypothetical protein